MKSDAKVYSGLLLELHLVRLFQAVLARAMPRSHLHIKPSCKSHVRRFSQNGVGRGYLVAVSGSGSRWQLRGLRSYHGNLPDYAVVTPLRIAASYEPRLAIFGIWGDTWLTRGKYGIYVAVRGSYGALTGST